MLQIQISVHLCLRYREVQEFSFKMVKSLCIRNAVCLDDSSGKPVYITMKLDPAESEFLRQQYEDIIPGYYMNKTHWSSVKAEGNVPDELLQEILEKSYRLVLRGFSKKKQRELLEEVKGNAV